MLSIYEDFYKSLGNVAVSGISASEIQGFLFKKILKVWTTGNWKIISTENIWNELVWDICTKRGISKKTVYKQLCKSENAVTTIAANFIWLFGRTN